MNKMTRLSIIIFSLFLSGCKPVIRLVNGEHLPSNENYNSLSQFISENNLPFNPEQCLYLKNKESKLILSGLFHTPGYYVAVPNVFVYNSNFDLIDDDKLGGCTVYRPEINGKDFYSELLSMNPLKYPSHTLDEWRESFIDYRGESFFPFERNGKAKIIILWSKYKGKKWAQDLNFIINTAKNSSTSLDIFYLNMDEYYQPS
jgi:hypothetical protein